MVGGVDNSLRGLARAGGGLEQEEEREHGQGSAGQRWGLEEWRTGISLQTVQSTVCTDCTEIKGRRTSFSLINLCQLSRNETLVSPLLPPTPSIMYPHHRPPCHLANREPSNFLRVISGTKKFFITYFLY